ncbi:P-loop containing nucleoside triphosphate hydrolase protein, partial [Mycena filopes]
GRDTELVGILGALRSDFPRIAILGAGGMGKTTLAKVLLHHPEVVAKYEHRLFVAAEGVTSGNDLVGLVGDYIGLRRTANLKRQIIQYFQDSPPYFLVLDNLETVWDPITSRGDVEDFLSQLTDVPHLALVVTMRGAERPRNVRWSHPFLPPLSPLSEPAARQTFLEIAGDSHDDKDIDQLLRFTDNMPLAVTLMAHMAEYEGCQTVLERWKEEKTSLFSDGFDKRSNLDASIRISIASPRIASQPGARDLLAILAVLPDGLSDVELLQSNLPLQDIRSCKAALLGATLAYVDEKKRCRVLVPIREHVQHFHSPAASLLEPIQTYFHTLLKVYLKHTGTVHMATPVA